NSGEGAGAHAQSAIEAEAHFGRLDLLRIGGTHRGEGVGERDSGLDVADAAEEFHGLRGEEGRVERRFSHGGFWEEALVSQVVDGEDSPAAEERGVGSERRAQVRGYQSGLPVVAVKDVGTEKMSRHADGGAGQHGETDVVVGVVEAVLAVEAFAVEIE